MKKTLLFVLLSLISLVIFGTKEIDAKSNELPVEVNLVRQDALVQQFVQMQSSYSIQYDFQDAFGGVYIEEDDLVINIVNSQIGMKIYRQIEEKYSFRVNLVEYSVKQLDDAIERLSEIMQSQDIVMIRRDDKTNSIDVILKSCSEEKVSNIKKIADIDNFLSPNFDIKTTAVEVINGIWVNYK